MDFLSDWYPWIRAFHIISVIAWMAGMLYLPRLFVYHVEAGPGSAQAETFKVMERRLLRLIINPAMGATFFFGILLLLTPGIVDWGAGWIWVKLVLIGAMTAAHGVFSRWRRQLEADASPHDARLYRMANEVPAVLMVAIVILVAVKPF